MAARNSILLLCSVFALIGCEASWKPPAHPVSLFDSKTFDCDAVAGGDEIPAARRQLLRICSRILRSVPVGTQQEVAIKPADGCQLTYVAGARSKFAIRRIMKICRELDNEPSQYDRCLLTTLRSVQYAKGIPESEARCRLWADGHKVPPEIALNLPDPVLALMPFSNLSEPGLEAAAPAHDEAIRSALARYTRLSLIGPEPVPGKPDPVAVGKEVGATHVLEGSFRQAGNRVRITYQLIDVAEGGATWSQVYDRSLAALSGIQEEIVADTTELLYLVTSDD